MDTHQSQKDILEETFRWVAAVLSGSKMSNRYFKSRSLTSTVWIWSRHSLFFEFLSPTTKHLPGSKEHCFSLLAVSRHVESRLWHFFCHVLDSLQLLRFKSHLTRHDPSSVLQRSKARSDCLQEAPIRLWSIGIQTLHPRQWMSCCRCYDATDECFVVQTLSPSRSPEGTSMA